MYATRVVIFVISQRTNLRFCRTLKSEIPTVLIRRTATLMNYDINRVSRNGFRSFNARNSVDEEGVCRLIVSKKKKYRPKDQKKSSDNIRLEYGAAWQRNGGQLPNGRHVGRYGDKTIIWTGVGESDGDRFSMENVIKKLRNKRVGCVC